MGGRAKVGRVLIFEHTKPFCMAWKITLPGCLLSFLVLAGFFFFSISRSCRPTWFKPVGARVIPIVLEESVCRIDTSGDYLPSQPVGFALNFENKYVAKAAIEPGILGIADTLKTLSIDLFDSTGRRVDVTEEFFYGQPETCDFILGSTHDLFIGDRPVDFIASLPGTQARNFSIENFLRAFNRIHYERSSDESFPTTGFQVGRSAFTFWLKPGSKLREAPALRLTISFATASGRQWSCRLHLRAAPSE